MSDKEPVHYRFRDSDGDELEVDWCSGGYVLFEVIKDETGMVQMDKIELEKLIIELNKIHDRME